MKVFLIIMGITTVISGLVILIAGFEYNMKKDFVNQIKACFPSPYFRHQSWTMNGSDVKDLKGNTEFYSCKDVDEAIDKLNEVLNKAK